MRVLLGCLLVFCGGAIGTGLRAALGLVGPGAGSGGAAAMLLAINLCGAFALGLLGSAPTSSPRHERLRLFLGTGLLGGFTSYSALILLALPQGGEWPSGLVLGAATIPLSIVAASVGLRAGRGLRDGESRGRAGGSR
ncbi:CrcB family protein [Leucobacter weissii]|uniref:Fluoride-specific ion channel FluC n=1 Tax=Leucobacter weissii TaxID=1983706 RepID=A0A939MPL1_9MICO|nr:CrcB family protein [Leucobacter weissii]